MKGIPNTETKGMRMRFPRLRSALAGLGATALAATLSGTATPAAGATERATSPPPECSADCERVFDLELPYDARLVGWRDGTVPGGDSVLTYRLGGKEHDTLDLPGRRVLDADCGWEGDAQRCAVTYDTGVHSAGALSVTLLADRGIVRTDEVRAATPGVELRHYDGNGRADLALRQSTYDPNYAEAPQYWETYLEFEGEFVRTGCAAPESESSPAPEELVYDTCVHH